MSIAILKMNELVAKLRAKAAAVYKSNDVYCDVGFTASYALYVHEDLNAYHKVGQAKFLEVPARELRGDLSNIIVSAITKGKTYGQALLLAGLRLQREAQKNCPVDTGALRNSAFTRISSGEEAVE